MNKKMLLTGIVAIALVGISGMIFTNIATGTDVVDTSVSDLKLNSENYDATMVSVEATVVNWTEKSFFVTVSDENGLVQESNFTRKYLIIQDIETSDQLFVRPVNDIPTDFISIGETITVTGYLENSIYNRQVELQENDVDGLLLIVTITNSNGNSLNIDTFPNRVKFQKFRTELQSNQVKFTVTVLEWTQLEFNVTITSTDFYSSHIVRVNFLKVQDIDTGDIYLVKIGGCKRSAIPSDFITVGEEIKITGVLTEISSANFTDKPMNFLFGDFENVLVGLSLENSSGVVYAPLREHFRPKGHDDHGPRHRRFGFHP